MSHSAGQQFGKYQLLERIAVGGMAEIYRARFEGAAGVTKPVVIKKILPHYAGNKNFVSMFINEAKIAVGLSHGNIAQVFDFGEIDGEYFLAMEFVHGQPLSKVIRRAREKGVPVIPTPFAVYILLELCKGLHYAHTRLDETGRPLNIIHRDVSAQNLILSYEGQVKVVDFGIAKARMAGRSETHPGAVKGKYVYFAPEQARGKELDARADIFASGIVLYEMLCGKLPFEGKMTDVLEAIVRGEFQRPRLLNPDITPALERIILTALANDRRERFETAQAFQEALAQYLYANAPTFSGSQLAQLMMFLYEPELVAEGRPVQLQREFLEQVPLWKKKLPDPATVPVERPQASPAPGSPIRARRSGVLDLERRHSEHSGTPTVTAEPTAQPPQPPSSPSDVGDTPSIHVVTDGISRTDPGGWRGNWAERLSRRWVLVTAPLVSAALAAGAVVGVGHFGTFAVQLTSDPAGARVEINGTAAPGTTPLLISDLAADKHHVLRVHFPGRKPWSRTVSPVRGATLTLHAELLPESASPSLPGAENAEGNPAP